MCATEKEDLLQSSVINVSDAKAQLSALLEEVAAGRRIILGKAGKPMALLVPYAPPRKCRKADVLKGQISMHGSFELSPSELEQLFGISPKASKD